MKNHVSMLASVLIFILLAPGCAPVISKALRDQVAKELSFREVLQDPEAHKGRIVLWGGVIIGAKNRKEGTLIEVLQKSADLRGRPKDIDRSDGRFLALYDGLLDVAIYSRGREITVAGEIQGKRVLALGEIEYTYPLISIKEIHLWPAESKERYYPYPYWQYPWWWYHPRPRYRYW